MTAAVLHAHQERCLAQAREAICGGRRKVLLVGPTGVGKTVLFSRIAVGHVDRGGVVLVVVHRRELLKQAAGRLRREGLDRVGIILSGETRDLDAPVIVASIGSLLAMQKRGEPLPAASLVIFDEAHHFVADEWGKIADVYGGSLLIGVTATPERSDGTPLGDLFEQLIVIASMRELIAGGFLVQPRVIAPAKRRRTPNESPVEAYRKHAMGRRAVVFLRSVAESEATAADFTAAGIPAASVDGELNSAVREQRLEAFASGELSVICNVFCLTEGWDCPPADCAILARGFGHVGPYLQAVGRVLRTSPGKTEAIILDLLGAVHSHGLPDDDREFSLDGKAIGGGDAPTKVCRGCGATILLSARVCPHCNEAFGGANHPEDLFEELREVSQETLEASYWGEQVKIAEQRGYRLGWVAHRFQEKFGRFPRKLWREAKAAA